jgi:hypothetical protein
VHSTIVATSRLCADLRPVGHSSTTGLERMPAASVDKMRDRGSEVAGYAYM